MKTIVYNCLQFKDTITNAYVNMSQVSYLLHVLVSNKAAECCLSSNSFYHRFQRRIMTKWRQLQECYGSDIYLDSCVVRGTMAHDLDCDDLRDFIYTLFLDTRTKMQYAVNEINQAFP